MNKLGDRTRDPLTPAVEMALSDLAYGVAAVRRLTAASPAEIIRLDTLSVELANAITRLDQGK